MRVFSASDVHIGDDTLRNDFVSNPGDLVIWKNQVKRFIELQKIYLCLFILNGDIFNSEYGLGDCINSKASEEIFNSLDKLKYKIIVKGNHDRGLENFTKHNIFKNTILTNKLYLKFSNHSDDEIERILSLEFRDDNFGKLHDLFIMGNSKHTDYYAHGNEHDIFNSGRLGFIGRKISKLAGLVGMINHRWEDKLRASGGRESNYHAFERVALEKAKGKKYNRMIHGHTHQPPKITHQYINTGIWSKNGWMEIPNV